MPSADRLILFFERTEGQNFGDTLDSVLRSIGEWERLEISRVHPEEDALGGRHRVFIRVYENLPPSQRHA